MTCLYFKGMSYAWSEKSMGDIDRPYRESYEGKELTVFSGISSQTDPPSDI